jgi:hypothetical protein
MYMSVTIYFSICSRSSQQQKTPSQSQKTTAANKNQQSTLRRRTLGSSENRFILKKRLFCNTREIPSDPIEVSLLYAQAVHSVVKVECSDKLFTKVLESVITFCGYFR